jgi:tetratricopeptide (TPR) repeat protein
MKREMHANLVLSETICNFRMIPKISFIIVFFIFWLSLLPGCVSHLKDAKFYYSQGQKFSRLYQNEKAIASFKKALIEAALEAEKHPSAQAFMLKGMAELNLELWEEAEESFLNAFSYGFEKGEEWAREISLLGLASSLDELKLEDSALKIYASILDKSRLKQVSIFAAQKYTEAMLKRALQKEGKEKQKLLTVALKAAEKLTNKDLSCGFYHYLQSQISSHLEDYKKSFEEAVMARELGLPKEEIFRDNDLQIVFCYQSLKEKLPEKEWEEFRSRYMAWVKRWNWRDAETPSWESEVRNAADN